MHLSSASKYRLHVTGVVKLTITITFQTKLVPFAVVANLVSDILLGTTYTDTHVEAIFTKKRYKLLANGERVPILKKKALSPITQAYEEPKEV